jgi:hypothetical protein
MSVVSQRRKHKRGCPPAETNQSPQGAWIIVAVESWGLTAELLIRRKPMVPQITEEQRETRRSHERFIPATPVRGPSPLPLSLLTELSAAPKPKLLDQVRHVLRFRHYSYQTEKTYVHWITRFIVFHHKRHPREMGKAEVEQFLTALAVERHVSAATQNQALHALLFLYRDVLTQELG